MAATPKTPNRNEQFPGADVRATLERCVQVQAIATMLVDVDCGKIQGSFEAIGDTLTMRLPHAAPRLPKEGTADCLDLRPGWAPGLEGPARSDPLGPGL